ncbi:hypothetical protein BC938DRAFT_476454 [Jimgerdemannia flammicorona]|uniref:Uncharacterized protein n=1 Tax=Jimgerdemannia flammicorona TaxID=994334 RepID=A0A433PH18_9FUNG|nr:hypothetical protein BC938DRAFT_476454 [Jimgerdemannia flammicorona]
MEQGHQLAFFSIRALSNPNPNIDVDKPAAAATAATTVAPPPPPHQPSRSKPRKTKGPPAMRPWNAQVLAEATERENEGQSSTKAIIPENQATPVQPTPDPVVVAVPHNHQDDTTAAEATTRRVSKAKKPRQKQPRAAPPPPSPPPPPPPPAPILPTNEDEPATVNSNDQTAWTRPEYHHKHKWRGHNAWLQGSTSPIAN